MSAALGVDWKIAVDYWMLGECVGRVKVRSGGLWMKFAGGWISDQKEAKVFVVLGLMCGEDEG